MEIKIARIKKGLTQMELCKRVKTSPRKIVQIERGDLGKVSFELAKRIAIELDSSINELFLNEEGQ